MRMPDAQASFFTDMHRAARLVDRQRPIIEMAVASLTREGHTILTAGVGPGRPFVVIAPSPLLAELVKRGKAAYWMRGTDADGHRFRRGELLDYRNCLVAWTERGS